MAKRTWRWVTRDSDLVEDVMIWMKRNRPKLGKSTGWWVSKSNDVVDNLDYSNWLEVFGVPLKPGEIKKVRFTCEVL